MAVSLCGRGYWNEYKSRLNFFPAENGMCALIPLKFILLVDRSPEACLCLDYIRF